MKRGKPLARSRMKKKPAPKGFPEEVRMRVARRSGFRCEARSSVCTTKAVEFHHRQLRRGDNHYDANCLHVCPACHTHIHANPTKSYMMGWMVSAWGDPTQVPVRFGDG